MSLSDDEGSPQITSTTHDLEDEDASNMYNQPGPSHVLPACNAEVSVVNAENIIEGKCF